jgi:uncharacterized protein YrrD
MPVVSGESGSRLGTLEGVEIDPAAARIVYLRLDRPGRHAPSVLPWTAIQSVGSDVILVDGESSLQQEVSPVQRPLLTPHVGDRPVVTECGDRLGTISSYDVEETTGAIRSYRIGGLLKGLFHSSVTFPPEAIRTFGRDAIIVDDAVAPGHRERAEPTDSQLLEEDGLGAGRARERRSA